MRFAALCGIAIFTSALAISADGPTFDAASVKLAGPDVRPPNTMTGGPGTNDPGRFRAPRIEMLSLLTRAFDVSMDQIVGPAWTRDFMSGNYYTIDATIPPGATKKQFHQMLQNLLVERFHLVFHHETRNFPGYELVVDKGGPKFKEVTPTPNVDPNAIPDMRTMLNGPRGADGFPNLPPGPQTMSQAGRGGQQRTKYQERSMAEFVSNLGFLIGNSQGKAVMDGYPQPRVVDKTGLTGKYTFVLEFYIAGAANSVVGLAALVLRGADSAAAQSPPVASEPDGGLPNIFTALQKQLGLRLDKVAAVPLDTVVVDSVDKVPTAN
jgi:uncharacterized protein (TIGR03435 family)